MADLKLPKDFIFGTATAAYQIEGAYNEDGKGESIWDRFTHTSGKIINNDTGDIACDHYHRYQEDVELMSELKLDAYRFSISWSRILPEGKKNINQKGIDFYNKLIDKLLSKNIIPFITLYHWDLPQKLEDIGGWSNNDISKYFADYSEICFRNFGDRVKYWITLNEPFCTAIPGYFTGEHAPGLRDAQKTLSAVQNLLLAHGESVSIFRSSGCKDGKIGITLNFSPTKPLTNSEEDFAATIRWNAILNELFITPIIYGKYPRAISDIFGFDIEIDTDLKKKINQKIDFLGVNYYSRNIVKYNPRIPFIKAEVVVPEGAAVSDMGWEIYPEGIYDLLLWIKNYYGNPPIYITENGMALKDELISGKVDDTARIEYLEQHLKYALKAKEEGTNLIGYFVWSLMDNFEWAYGYTKRFGIIYIDYVTLKRVPKKSYYWIKELLANR
jgi:beta-glucosidase